MDDLKEHNAYVCSIYEKRPMVCVEYPWNFANTIFKDCIFVDATSDEPRLRTMEEQLELNTAAEISEYCVSCGKCCFFGPAACSKLQIIKEKDATNRK
jgi:hypothetical protein